MQKKLSLADLFVVLNQLPMALGGIVHSVMHNGISLSKFERSAFQFVHYTTRLSKIRNQQRNVAPVSHLRIGSALFARPLYFPQP
ncbi:hypothetical protein [Saccharibacillus sp. JS10]|uniref:hypothetical protein n=1 Tax=Saccharibacillus sp. JS10 TaxID=2950552 RepID=UPI00210895CF|nr:hypothetical protein [Saccharibacillus sp. JS10]MCQ4088066.1 hypothetical protein [Saccharibacillus sp. JS10]